MTKDVLITMTGFQFLNGEGEPEPVEVLTAGEYYKKNGSHYLLYEEAQEDGALIRNMIKFSEDRLLVHKSGSVNVEMLFENGKKTISMYRTPFGSMEMRIATTYFALREEEEQIDYRVDYALNVNDTFAADCQLMLRVRPRRVPS